MTCGGGLSLPWAAVARGSALVGTRERVERELTAGQERDSATDRGAANGRSETQAMGRGVVGLRGQCSCPVLLLAARAASIGSCSSLKRGSTSTAEGDGLLQGSTRSRRLACLAHGRKAFVTQDSLVREECPVATGILAGQTAFFPTADLES